VALRAVLIGFVRGDFGMHRTRIDDVRRRRGGSRGSERERRVHPFGRLRIRRIIRGRGHWSRPRRASGDEEREEDVAMQHHDWPLIARQTHDPRDPYTTLLPRMMRLVTASIVDFLVV